MSLPLKNPSLYAEKLRREISYRTGKLVNVLIVDTDRSFKPCGLRGIVFATRLSSIKGVIDLGGHAYIIGKVFKKLFASYPTPVAYAGIDIGLPMILRIAKIGSKYMRCGLGRNIIEVVRNIGTRGFDSLRWYDMDKVRHYPVFLIRLKILSSLST